MLENQNDPRQLIYREHHLSGKWKVYSWEPERKPQPPPTIEYKMDFATGKIIKVVREAEEENREASASPVDALESPHKLREPPSGRCKWFECLQPLDKGQRRYCDRECRERDKAFHRKELAQWRRAVANMSEGDEDFVSRVVDEASYLRIVNHVRADISGSESKPAFFVIKGRLGTWQSLEVQGEKQIVEMFMQEQVKGRNIARKRHPILPEEDLVSLTITQDNAVPVEDREGSIV